jgi:hypothetical protein
MEVYLNGLQVIQELIYQKPVILEVVS